MKAIKKRIEDLISRDYLERDKDNSNLFRYLAWFWSWLFKWVVTVHRNCQKGKRIKCWHWWIGSLVSSLVMEMHVLVHSATIPNPDIWTTVDACSSCRSYRSRLPAHHPRGLWRPLYFDILLQFHLMTWLILLFIISYLPTSLPPKKKNRHCVRVY